MSSMESFSLLQASILLTGIAWKLREGYPILNVPDFSRLFEREVGVPRLYTWLDLFTGASVESLLNDWPWFSLHLFLYVGQLFPLIIIVINEWPFRTRALTAVSLSAVMGFLSTFAGFAATMPVISLWILRKSKQTKHYRRALRYRIFPLRFLFSFSAATHIGAFLAAFIATWIPSLLPLSCIGPLHITNSLIGVPDAMKFGLSDTSVRQARLRQINEMTGTSSGFFLTVGLLSHVLEWKGRRMTLRLIAWMFLVSLVAGPAAGGAAVLLFRDDIVNSIGLGQHRQAEREKRE